MTTAGAPEPGHGNEPAGTAQPSSALREFLREETSSGAALLFAAIVALAWANSPWRASYVSLWNHRFSLRIGGFGIADSLRDWVNDGLMALFFFVAGIEIKRELVHGKLRAWRAAATPIIAAVGGMVVPAALFVAVTHDSSVGHGWGVPMATDIAFAVGVVTLLGRRVPAPLKLFLLTLAIVDDIGAIIVIAIFYGGSINWFDLAIAIAVLALMVVAWSLGLRQLRWFVIAGIGVWLATKSSGVHGTVAGVALGLLVPTTAPLNAGTDERTLEGAPEPAAAPLIERLEHRLHPWSAFVVIPIFALANTGVRFDSAVFDAAGASRVALAIGIGLAFGKVIGVSCATWLAVKLGIGVLPSGSTWLHLVGVGAIAGVGFTVSLFVTQLAFASPALIDAAKLAILAASAIAAIGGSTLIVIAHRRTNRQRQLVR